MKKLAILLSLLLFTGVPALAQCESDLCVAPYDLSAGVSRFFSSVTGSNFLAQKVAQAIARKEIRKVSENNSKLKVKVKSFSTKDLKAGRFKSMKVSGKNLAVGNVYISELEAETVCDFNYIMPNPSNKNEVIFKEALPIRFKTKMSQDDLNSMIKSPDYRKVIDQLNSLGGNFGFFKISSTEVRIKNNKFLYVMKVGIPFVKGYHEVILSSGLKVRDGVVVLTDPKLMNTNFNIGLTKLSYMLNYLNPLDYSLNIIDNKDTKLSIKDVSIENNMVVLEGTVTVAKDTVE